MLGIRLQRWKQRYAEIVPPETSFDVVFNNFGSDRIGSKSYQYRVGIVSESYRYLCFLHASDFV